MCFIMTILLIVEKVNNRREQDKNDEQNDSKVEGKMTEVDTAKYEGGHKEDGSYS